MKFLNNHITEVRQPMDKNAPEFVVDNHDLFINKLRCKDLADSNWSEFRYLCVINPSSLKKNSLKFQT